MHPHTHTHTHTFTRIHTHTFTHTATHTHSHAFTHTLTHSITRFHAVKMRTLRKTTAHQGKKPPSQWTLQCSRNSRSSTRGPQPHKQGTPPAHTSTPRSNSKTTATLHTPCRSTHPTLACSRSHSRSQARLGQRTSTILPGPLMRSSTHRTAKATHRVSKVACSPFTPPKTRSFTALLMTLTTMTTMGTLSMASTAITTMTTTTTTTVIQVARGQLRTPSASKP